jgi:tetratricopeptide (TPR) repeat protein
MRGYVFALLVTFMALWLEQATAEPQASRTTFVKLMDVQELWESQDYGSAIAILEELLANTRDEPYDYALANQYLAHTCVMAGCPERTRGALETALAQPGLPDEMLEDLTLFYAQVLLVEEAFAEASRYYEKWLAMEPEEPEPTQLFSAGYANYMVGDYARTSELLSMAISREDSPPDSWIRLQYQALMELKRFDAAEELAVSLVENAPNNEEYWRLLANHYLRLENGRQALSVLSIGYQQGVLTDTDDARRMVSLYRLVAAPERAARLVEKLLDEGAMERDFDTLTRLGNLWLLSRERGEALAVLKQAAAIAPDGDTYELLGNIYFEDEQWLPAHESFLAALEFAETSDRPRLEFLAGISAYRAGMEPAARTHLRRAEKSEEFGSQASSLLRRLDQT